MQQQTIDNFQLLSPTVPIPQFEPLFISRCTPWQVLSLCQKVQQRRISPACLRIAASRGVQNFQKSRIHRQNYGRRKGDIMHVPYWRSTNIRPQLKNLWSRDSSVGIATHYGLDGPGIECRWERDFPHLSRQTLRPIQLPIQWVPGLFRG